jgi:hypothetical protein
MSNPTIQRLLARTAANEPARTKARGGKGLAARALACVHLGEKVPGQPCGGTLIKCEKFGDVATRFIPCKAAARCCRDCPDYSAPPSSAASESSPSPSPRTT